MTEKDTTPTRPKPISSDAGPPPERAPPDPDEQARPDDARERHHAEVPRLEAALDAAGRVD
jgi:hypothetical protein